MKTTQNSMPTALQDTDDAQRSAQTRDITKIRIRQIEGRVGQLVNAVVLTVEGADRVIRRIGEAFTREHPEGNAGYWKVDTEVLFDDGTAVYTRLDVNERAAACAPFAALYGTGYGVPTAAPRTATTIEGENV